MEDYSITEPKVKKRQTIVIELGSIPLEFYVKDIVDGIPHIEIYPWFYNEVINTEYQDGAVAPLRKNQKYTIQNI